MKVFIAPFADSRETAEPKKIGDIKTTVFDITGSELVLTEEPSKAVEAAFATEFSRAGFKVAREEEAEYVLRGEVRKFRLDIGPRDEIEVELSLEMAERETGRVVWAKTVEEKDSRYAGVFGNSRDTISRYISAALSKVTVAAIEEVSPLLAGKEGDGKEEPGETGGEIPSGLGRLLVATEPGRAKLYVDGVYYGLTPVSVDIEPGVHELVIKKEGFSDFTEKVAVGEGRVTELEETLGK